MQKPKFPYSILTSFIAICSISLYQVISSFLNSGLTLKLLGGAMAMLIFCLLSGFIFFAFYDKYKREQKYLKNCTIADNGKVISVGLSTHNTGNINPTFISVSFAGHEKTFTNIEDSFRFTFKENDPIDILYNPNKKNEFIFNHKREA